MCDKNLRSGQVQRGTLEDKLKELLEFAEGDAKAWDDAAQHCEELANGLPESKRAECNLVCAVYRERAKLHREMVAKFRQP
jgi:hypothetical protein